ncbi:MAG TPA: hypothetical protein VK636_12320 [Gemmatimonadaceae bacterium]|nr:hypothetical protein [Gemmatimonadaceae bacterium]
MASAAAVALLAAIASALPQQDGVIHGCVEKLTGLTRIVIGGGCLITETPVSWNQTGPPGPGGPKGETGATGATGPQGPAGTAAAGGTGPKALVYVDIGLAAESAIVRCHNFVTGDSIPPCGFKFTPSGDGPFELDFGFKVDDRFVVASPQFMEGSGVILAISTRIAPELREPPPTAWDFDLIEASQPAFLLRDAVNIVVY